MSKRGPSKGVAHPRRPRDEYQTPPKAAAPLLPFLAPGTVFAEPCAAAGRLVDHLTAAGHVCAWAGDIHPLRHDVAQADAMAAKPNGAQVFITNPPWKRSALHSLILHLSDQLPTWVLIDADWAQLAGAHKLWRPCVQRLRKVVAVGRVQWEFPGSTKPGFDNAAWMLFDQPNGAPVEFYPQGVGPQPPAKARRVCADCRQIIGPRDRWRLAERGGQATTVHKDCANPRGLPAPPQPMALFPEHDYPQPVAAWAGPAIQGPPLELVVDHVPNRWLGWIDARAPGPCARCAHHQPLPSGAYYCDVAKTWAMPDPAKPCVGHQHAAVGPQAAPLPSTQEGGQSPQHVIANAVT